MLRDLLTLSKISNQVVGATCQTAIVAAVVRDELTPMLEAVGGLITVEAAFATVPCSEGLLRQALWNLGENAVKYRRPGEQLRVDIHGVVTSGGYEFKVADNAKGMSFYETRLESFLPRQGSTSHFGHRTWPLDRKTCDRSQRRQRVYRFRAGTRHNIQNTITAGQRRNGCLTDHPSE